MIFLLWTGGFDSTWRLLHIITVQKVPVTPVYLEGKIDHHTSGGRKTDELIVIGHLLGLIKQYFPSNYHLIKPLQQIPINTLSPSPEDLAICRNLYLQKRLHRPICQLTYLLTLSNLTDFQEHSPECCYVKTDLLLRNQSDPPNQHTYESIKNLQFPLYCYGKAEMWAFAEKYNWTKILEQTVSCWYYEKGICGTCSMCKTRASGYLIYKHRKRLHQELMDLFNYLKC